MDKSHEFSVYRLDGLCQNENHRSRGNRRTTGRSGKTWTVTPTDRQVELYYFDVWEVCQMLGRPHPSTVTDLIRDGKVEAVKHRNKWIIAPDQVGVLRNLIPHCRPNNLKELNYLKVRNWYRKVRNWCTSAWFEKH